MFKRAIMHHLPEFLSGNSRYRQRVSTLPQKYLFAILAAEIGSAMVYRGDQEADFEEFVQVFLNRNFPEL